MLGQFISPDTIVPEPGRVFGYNRTMYAVGNPLKYTDPSGHWFETAVDIAFLIYDLRQIRQEGLTRENGLSLAVDLVTTALPVVAGGSLIVRGAAHADDAVDAVRTAGHLGDATHVALKAERALDAANDLKRVGAHSDEGQTLIQEIARLSTNGTIKPAGNTVVLGRFTGSSKYMGYIDKAKEMVAVYFSTPSEAVWNALDKPWLVNKQFLDDAIARGDRFWIEADFDRALKLVNEDGTIPFLRQELEYLQNKGYVYLNGYMVRP